MFRPLRKLSFSDAMAALNVRTLLTFFLVVGGLFLVPHLFGGRSQLPYSSSKLGAGIIKKDYSADYEFPTSDAQLSCLLPEIKLAPSRRTCNPYKSGGTFPTATRLDKMAKESILAQSKVMLGGVVAPSEAVKDGIHYKQDTRVRTPIIIEERAIELNHPEVGYETYYIDRIPCQIAGCCGLVYNARRNSTDMVSTNSFFINADYKFMLDMQGLNPKYILDVGGVGLSAVWLALLYPDATILRLEPHPDNFLIGAINSYGLNNIFQVPLGLYNTTVVLQMCHRMASTDAWFEQNGFKSDTLQQLAWYVRLPDDPPCERVAVEAVRVTTLDKIVEMLNIPHFDLVKMDIEGAELQVFSHQPSLDIMAKATMMTLESHDRYTPGSSAKVYEFFHNSGMFNTYHDGENEIYIKKSLFQEGCH